MIVRLGMPPQTPSGTELVRKVAYHFEEIFTDDEDVLIFFTENLEHFEDEFEEEEGKVEAEEEKEHKMIYTDLYKEFELLMEDKITEVSCRKMPSKQKTDCPLPLRPHLLQAVNQFNVTISPGGFET